MNIRQRGVDARNVGCVSLRRWHIARAPQEVDETARQEPDDQPGERAFEARHRQANKKTDAAQEPFHLIATRRIVIRSCRY